MLDHDSGRKELVSEFGKGDTIGVIEFATGMSYSDFNSGQTKIV